MSLVSVAVHNQNIDTTRPPSTVDGVSLTSGTRLLLLQQTDGKQNGTWVVSDTSSLVRPDDMYVGAHVSGATVGVIGGSKRGHRYRCTAADGADVVGTHSLTWQTEYTTSDEITSLVTKSLVDGLGVRAQTLRPDPSSGVDDGINRTYINGLNIQAGTLGSTATADMTTNRTYIEELRIAAATLASVDETEKTTNRTYINSLGVTASRLGSINRDLCVCMNPGHDLTTDGDDVANKAYIEGLNVESVTSSRRLVLHGDGISSSNAQSDITANADYARNTLGLGTFHLR